MSPPQKNLFSSLRDLEREISRRWARTRDFIVDELFGGNGNGNGAHGSEPADPARARRYVLLNPGPVLISQAVKNALADAEVCHRDSDYTKLIERLHAKLLSVFRGDPDDYGVLLLTGSGTAAVEASIASCIPKGKKLLAISNGSFGERLQEIGQLHGVAAEPLRYPWAGVVRPEDVDARLTADPDIFAVAMVHHETSMGIINPVRAVGEVVAAHDRLYLVDCISSLGGEDLDVRREHIDLCVACANKCLHAVSGISFVCVHRRVWERIAHVPERSLYLDLRRYRRYLTELGQTPFTPSVASFFALDQALTELLEDGLPRRLSSYRELNRILREGLTRLGLEITNGEERASHTVTCVRVPPFIHFDEMYEELKAFGFIIYNGKSELEDRVFQVANMGALTQELVRDFLCRLGAILERHRSSREASYV
jgi:2-aminoethylphosphonate-pyruvate transaminase